MASLDEHTTRELIERSRQGDPDALSELVHSHEKRLLDSVRAELGRRIRQRLESCDIVQQVYLEALRDVHRFCDRGGDSFFHWLRAIAINRIRDADRDAFRTTKRGPELRAADLGDDASMLDLFEQVRGSLTSPTAAVRRDEQLELLARALARLSEDHREALRLRYLRHLDVPATAARMNRSERAVRSLCVRALIRLREILDDAS